MSTSLIDSLNRIMKVEWTFDIGNLAFLHHRTSLWQCKLSFPPTGLQFIGWFNALLNACLHSQHLTYIIEFPELFVLKSHIESFRVDSTLEQSIVDLKGFS